MIFKVNCERCEDLLITGKIYNYSGKSLCEDCYILMYLFGGKASDAASPDVQLRRRVPTAVGLRLSAKR